MTAAASQTKYFAKFYNRRNISNNSNCHLYDDNVIVFTKLVDISPYFINSQNNILRNDNDYLLLNSSEHHDYNYNMQMIVGSNAMRYASKDNKYNEIQRLKTISGCHIIAMMTSEINDFAHLVCKDPKLQHIAALFNTLIDTGFKKCDVVNHAINKMRQDDIKSLYEFLVQQLNEALIKDTKTSESSESAESAVLAKYEDNYIHNTCDHYLVNLFNKKYITLVQCYNLMFSSNGIDTMNNGIVDVVTNNFQANDRYKATHVDSNLRSSSRIIENTTNDNGKYSYITINLYRNTEFNARAKSVDTNVIKVCQYIEATIFSGKLIDNFRIVYNFNMYSISDNTYILSISCGMLFYMKANVLNAILNGQLLISNSCHLFLTLAYKQRLNVNNQIKFQHADIPIIFNNYAHANNDFPKYDKDLTDRLDLITNDQLAIRFKKYQYRNLLWMNNHEGIIRNHGIILKALNYCGNLNLQLVNILNETDLYHFAVEKTFTRYGDSMGILSAGEEYLKDHLVTRHFNGGIIADDVGLGKTIQAITHIMNQLDADNLNSKQFNANNLVIVPARLISQWMDEFTKCIKPEHRALIKIFKIATIADIKRLEYVNIRDYNVYLMSANMLNNVNYRAYLNGVQPKTRSRGNAVVESDDDDDEVPNTRSKVVIPPMPKPSKTNLRNPEIPADEYALYEEQAAKVLGISVEILIESKRFGKENFFKGIPDRLIGDTKSITPFKKIIKTIVEEFHDNHYERFGNVAALKETLTNTVNIMTFKQSQKKLLEKYINELIYPDMQNGAEEDKADKVEKKKKAESEDAVVAAIKEKPKKLVKFDIYNIHWNRIFHDEAHEKTFDDRFATSAERMITENLIRLHSNYKWILSATPVANGESNMIGMLNFFYYDPKNIKISRDRSYSYDFNPSKCLSGITTTALVDFITKITRRNLKSDVKEEIDIPPFTEDIELLTQSTIERNIYMEVLRNNDIARLFKLCTHPQVSDQEEVFNHVTDIMSLTEINEKITKKFQKQKVDLESTNLALEERNNALTVSIPIAKKIETHFKTIAGNGVSPDMQSQIHKNYPYYSIISNSDENIARMKHTGVYYIREYLMDIIKKYTRSMLKDEMTLDELDETRLDEIAENSMRDVLPFTDTLNERRYALYLIIHHINAAIANDINKNQRQIEDNVTELKRLDNVMATFTRTEFVKESANDPCGICFSDFQDYLCLTVCRHVLCKDCMAAVFQRGGEFTSCPFCRHALNPSLVNNVTLESLRNNEAAEIPVEMQEYKIQSNEEMEDKKRFHEDINKYGTKLAHLMKYLNTIFKDPKSRVIIFSQYDKMLTLIGSVLAQFAIQHVYVKGNVFVVNKNIKKFKEDPNIRVIMLSSETASSGSNLTEASHIVFVNVMNANKDETLALETQCIGRSIRLGQNKSVVIKRFIMQNTIEQEYFDKNKYDIATLQA